MSEDYQILYDLIRRQDLDLLMADHYLAKPDDIMDQFADVIFYDYNGGGEQMHVYTAVQYIDKGGNGVVISLQELNSYLQMAFPQKVQADKPETLVAPELDQVVKVCIEPFPGNEEDPLIRNFLNHDAGHIVRVASGLKNSWQSLPEKHPLRSFFRELALIDIINQDHDNILGGLNPILVHAISNDKKVYLGHKMSKMKCTIDKCDLPLQEKLLMLEDLFRRYECIRKKGIIWNDIKCSNIMIPKTGISAVVPDVGNFRCFNEELLGDDVSPITETHAPEFKSTGDIEESLLIEAEQFRNTLIELITGLKPQKNIRMSHQSTIEDVDDYEIEKIKINSFDKVVKMRVKYDVLHRKICDSLGIGFDKAAQIANFLFYSQSDNALSPWESMKYINGLLSA